MNFLHAMTALGYLPKLKRVCFMCTFSLWFFHKNVLYLILCQLTKSYLFSLPTYQTKCVFKFSFRHLSMPQTLRFIFVHPLKQWLGGKKREEDGNTKTWISWEWKEHFRWNNKDFS